MSNSYTKPRLVNQEDRLLRFFVPAAVLLVFIAFVVVVRYRSDRPWPSISAQVLETRIVTLGAVDATYRGGVILYRAEVYVSYELNGKEIRRWLPASDTYSDKGYLAFWLSQKKSKVCIVHWNPNNPSDMEAVLLR